MLGPFPPFITMCLYTKEEVWVCFPHQHYSSCLRYTETWLIHTNFSTDKQHWLWHAIFKYIPFSKEVNTAAPLRQAICTASTQIIRKLRFLFFLLGNTSIYKLTDLHKTKLIHFCYFSFAYPCKPPDKKGPAIHATNNRRLQICLIFFVIQLSSYNII